MSDLRFSYVRHVAMVSWFAFCCIACEAQPPSVGDGTPSASAQTTSDARLKRFLTQSPELLSSRIATQSEHDMTARWNEFWSAREALVQTYNAAKARGEKPKPVARPKLPVLEDAENVFPAWHHENLIAELYGVDAHLPVYQFVAEDGTLTAKAQRILSAAENADEHALSPELFGVTQLRGAADRLGRMQQALTQKDGLSLNDHELAAIVRAFEAGSVPGLSATEFQTLPENEAFTRLIDALATMETSPVPRLSAAIEGWTQRTQYVQRFRDQLEFAFADLALFWAETLKFGNLEKFSKEEYDKYTTEAAPNDIHPKYMADIVEDRLRVEFEALSGITSDEDMAAHLDDLLPHHMQYERLKQARQRYRQIVEDGGWNEVPPDNMNAGGRAPLVMALKKRLAAEGYFNGDVSNDLFDADLTKAILAYQTHHQLDLTGKVDQTFWRSLNVNAEQRLAEIEVNIRRWHRTMFVPRDRYIYINIPSFTVELWDQGKLVTSHKVVVGASTRICNTRTREWELMNSTKLMHAHMTYLVFNPYWNVPPRIEVDEYQKRIADDPKWLANSDFEYWTPKGGGRVLRQKPGPNNALGKVKLIFPNRYNVYLHDTPKQGMFEYSVRAFSHGCMRVQGAMDFAQKVLELDGQWDKKESERWFKEKGEHAVDLINPIDVFIEYHTVTVDDEGQPYFLADVYKIIKNQITPPTAQERACDPAVDKVSNFRAGGGDTGP